MLDMLSGAGELVFETGLGAAVETPEQAVSQRRLASNTATRRRRETLTNCRSLTCPGAVGWQGIGSPLEGSVQEDAQRARVLDGDSIEQESTSPDDLREHTGRTQKGRWRPSKKPLFRFSVKASLLHSASQAVPDSAVARNKRVKESLLQPAQEEPYLGGCAAGCAAPARV